MKKKEATGAVSYVMLFTMALLMVIITFYLLSVAKLMSIQHDVDDALADAVLASLVADDVYYFETYEGLGAPVIRFKNREVSCGIYRDCMEDAMSANDFYENISYAEFILYEVEGRRVTVTTYKDPGTRSMEEKLLGSVSTPTGEVVTKTSAYARVDFDLKSLITTGSIRKSRDIYCTLKIN